MSPYRNPFFSTLAVNASRASRMVAVLIALGALGCETIVKPSRPAPVQTEVHTTDTADGWTLVLHRYTNGTNRASHLPVILCHGFSCNGRFFDLTPNLSLARHLALEGFDVWVPDLRGSGHSTKPGIVYVRRLIRPTIPELPSHFGSFALDPRKGNWTMDDHIEHDIPAILSYIATETGWPRAVWMGHSMGGTVALGRIQRFGEPRIAAFAGLATSVTMPQPPNQVLRSVGAGGLPLKLSSLLVGLSVPTTIAGRAGIHLADSLMYNRDNISTEAIQQIYFRVMEDVPPGVLNQQIGAINTGEYRSADGQFDYSAHLDRIDMPVLLMTGPLDNLCPPESSRHIYRRVGTPEIVFLEAGVINGFQANYGHFDLIAGHASPTDIYPRLSAWLRRHAQPAAGDRLAFEEHGLSAGGSAPSSETP